ncbi:hypothetical protein N7520_003584 [Penicillium odoratum]|uniref:uncharacterized protein n=1 Tax=Penicillium odoratum TaxID=1167516 RepID=UPI002548A034|nr:uncharacterized protein N7520_003584 [Penicillium odoratum]KAJ5769025.1 hypothetical protein N7520_003584 [Penicillium odoratum]
MSEPRKTRAAALKATASMMPHLGITKNTDPSTTKKAANMKTLRAKTNGIKKPTTRGNAELTGRKTLAVAKKATKTAKKKKKEARVKATKKAKTTVLKQVADEELPHNVGPKAAPLPAATSAGSDNENKPLSDATVTKPAPDLSPNADAIADTILDSIVDPTVNAASASKAASNTPKKPAVKNYALTPGVTPFPSWPHPTPEECEEVNKLLSNVHGVVTAPKVIPPPSLTVTGCGEVPSVLDAVIRTLLSGATTTTNASRAFEGLVKRFGILKEGIGAGSVNWDAVRRASLKEVFEAIKSGGLADIKSQRLKAILDLVYEDSRQRLGLAATEDGSAAPVDEGLKMSETNVEAYNKTHVTKSTSLGNDGAWMSTQSEVTPSVTNTNSTGDSNVAEGKSQESKDHENFTHISPANDEDPVPAMKAEDDMKSKVVTPAGSTNKALKMPSEFDLACAEQNILSLNHLHSLSSEDAMMELMKYPGIGPKTAACVLLFCLQRPCFAVDTHIFRLSKWLGWVPDTKVNEITAFSHLEVRIPNHLKYSLHQLLIRHGKDCPRCRAATGDRAEGWEDGCVIDHLVTRTGKRKGVISTSKTAKKTKTKAKTKANAKAELASQKRKKTTTRSAPAKKQKTADPEASDEEYSEMSDRALDDISD